MFMMTSSNGNIFHITGYLCVCVWGGGGGGGIHRSPAKRPVTGSFDVIFDLHPGDFRSRIKK